MLYSNQMDFLTLRYGIETAVDMMIEAGYTAIDVSMFKTDCVPFTDDYREVAERLKSKADAAGVKFVQAHAPFGGGYKNYTENLLPLMPRSEQNSNALGIRGKRFSV